MSSRKVGKEVIDDELTTYGDPFRPTDLGLNRFKSENHDELFHSKFHSEQCSVVCFYYGSFFEHFWKKIACPTVVNDTSIYKS